MFGAIAGGIASALAGGAMSKLFGGGQKAASGGIQGDVLATDNNTVGMGDAGIKSAIQGSNVPNPDEAVPSFVSGAMAKAGKGLLEGTLQAGTSAVSDKLLDLVGLGGKSAADKGKDTRDYLAAAFPELNAWERAGADASSAGMVDAGFENQKELTKMHLDNQKEIAEMQNETQKEIAGIQSATSRQNTKDQVYAQNEMLAYQQKESTARVASIMENTNLSKQQQGSEIMRQMLTQAQTAGQYFANHPSNDPAGRDKVHGLVLPGDQGRRDERTRQRSARRAEIRLHVDRAVLPCLVPAGVPHGEIDDEVARGLPRMGRGTSRRCLPVPEVPRARVSSGSAVTRTGKGDAFVDPREGGRHRQRRAERHHGRRARGRNGDERQRPRPAGTQGVRRPDRRRVVALRRIHMGDRGTRAGRAVPKVPSVPVRIAAAA